MRRFVLLFSVTLFVTFLTSSLCQEASEVRAATNPEAQYYNQLCSRDLESGHIFHAYSTKNYGCIADCTILSSSSSQYSQFLDQSTVKTHLISGKICINETYVCLNGTCVINPLRVDPQAISLVPSLPGQGDDNRVNRPITIPINGNHGSVKIVIHNGYVRHDDNVFSKGDIYVKVFVNSRSVGTTAISPNTYNPSFEQTFIVDSLTRMDVLRFEIWDSDTEHDDYLGSVATTCDEVITKRMNNKRKTHHWSRGTAGFTNRVVLTINCQNF